MVYLRGLFVKTLFSTTILLVILSLSQDVEAGTMKIAYKKPIFGKLSTTKERRYKLRPDYMRKTPMNAAASVSTGMSTSASSLVGSTMLTTTSSTTPTLLHSLAPTDWNAWATTTPLSVMEGSLGTHYNNNMESNKAEAEAAIYMPKPMQYEHVATHSQYMDLNPLKQSESGVDTLLPDIMPPVNNTLEAPQLHHDVQAVHVIDANMEAQSNTNVMSDTEANAEVEELFPLPQPELLVAPRALSTRSNTHAKARKTSKTTATTTEHSRAVPCTCGVFLASQIKRGTNEQPEGAPVITNELDRTFACNAVGQKQCQTKCLETIVQHLPNSANILCATLNRDCRKERAYLFIKNCRNQWHNTNLSAGREYCCRDGQPYTCPMV
uniref:Follicle cell protein 3C-1 n=1 Tax=Bactrocera dorsalis TaxID=27457 RepID=A0A034WRT4_BACDO